MSYPSSPKGVAGDVGGAVAVGTDLLLVHVTDCQCLCVSVRPPVLLLKLKFEASFKHF